jgi:hypothetical protein
MANTVTFTRRTVTMDESTGQTTETTSTITGGAIQVRGRPDTYRALSLIESSAPTLLFTPTTYNLHAGSDEFVMPGDEVTWAGETYTARDVSPVAPDGFVIAARIVVTR